MVRTVSLPCTWIIDIRSPDKIDKSLVDCWRADDFDESRNAIKQIAKVGKENEYKSLVVGHPDDGLTVDIKPFGGLASKHTAPSKHFQLQNLFAGAEAEVLETAVECGVEILEELKKPMLDKASQAPDAAQWLQQIGTARLGWFFSLMLTNGRECPETSRADQNHSRGCRQHRLRKVFCHQCYLR